MFAPPPRDDHRPHVIQRGAMLADRLLGLAIPSVVLDGGWEHPLDLHEGARRQGVVLDFYLGRSTRGGGEKTAMMDPTQHRAFGPRSIAVTGATRRGFPLGYSRTTVRMTARASRRPNRGGQGRSSSCFEHRRDDDTSGGQG